MFGKDDTGQKIRVAFPAMIERKTPVGNQTFKINVEAHFEPRRGTPHFVAEKIMVVGIENMDIRSFFPDEIKSLSKWTQKNVWPNLTKFKVK